MINLEKKFTAFFILLSLTQGILYRYSAPTYLVSLNNLERKLQEKFNFLMQKISLRELLRNLAISSTINLYQSNH